LRAGYLIITYGISIVQPKQIYYLANLLLIGVIFQLFILSNLYVRRILIYDNCIVTVLFIMESRGVYKIVESYIVE